MKRITWAEAWAVVIAGLVLMGLAAVMMVRMGW